MTQDEERPRRSGPELVVASLSVGVLLAVAAAIVVLWIGGAGAPPDPTAVAGPVERASQGLYVVPVDVLNRGGQTVGNVQVVATVRSGGEQHEGEQTIDFLAGGETVHLRFLFPSDPGAGELDVRVASFEVP